MTIAVLSIFSFKAAVVFPCIQETKVALCSDSFLSLTPRINLGNAERGKSSSKFQSLIEKLEKPEE